MPLYWKSKTLLAKMETVYNTDPVPTAAANAILARNVVLSPMEGQDVGRDLERAWFGNSDQLPVGLYATLSFEVEAVASGTLGTVPGWGVLHRMCGAAEVVTAGVKVEYTPITDTIESGTLYLWIDTVRHVLTGARGTCKLRLDAQGIPVWAYAFTGLFAAPTTQAKVTPVYTAFQAPKVATKTNTPTFTIGGTAFLLRSFEFDMGNDVQTRMLVGYEGVHIVDRAESVKATVEAVALATYNPFTVAQNRTLQVIQLIHDTTAGRKIQFDAASAQQRRLSGYQENQKIVEYPLDFVPLPTTGNDQWKITLN